MTAPRVYSSIVSVTTELARTGVPKTQVNAVDRYSYRSIDDLLTRLAPLFAKHRLCILPRILERACVEREGMNGSLLSSISLRVAFDVVSARDGSQHVIEVFGEALDEGDKGTSKAMSSAYKQAMIQLFCIPAHGAKDADGHSHRTISMRDIPDPDQGWDQWSEDIQDMLRHCETEEAIQRVQTTYGALLRAASKRRPDIFGAIGSAFEDRKMVVNTPIPKADIRKPVKVAANG